MSDVTYPFVDTALARRLERTEAHANRRFVEARARLSPDVRAAWIDVDGTYAMFDGVDSPLTQTFGLGLFAPVTEQGLGELESFLTGRGSPPFHEVSPLADPSALALLNVRGYEPFEFTSVMCRPLSTDMFRDSTMAPGLTTFLEPSGSARWAQLTLEGWSELPELTAFLLEMGKVWATTEDLRCFIAALDDEPIAAGASLVHDGVVLLAGASTAPRGRRRGAQNALLECRLRDAAERGADLAMMCAQPGSASQRNAERQGFRIAYTRIKWRPRAPRAPTAPSAPT